MIRGTAAEGQFVYEILWLCPVFALTSLDELRKIRCAGHYIICRTMTDELMACLFIS